MRPSRWLILVGALLTVGILQAVWHNAVFVKGYELGAARSKLRREAVDLSWLRTEVSTLTSPSALLDVADSRQLSLVATVKLPGGGAASAPTVEVTRLVGSPVADDE